MKATASNDVSKQAWNDVSQRDRTLLRIMLELEHVLDVTGEDTAENREWFAWSEQARLHIKAHLVRKGVL